MATKQQDKPTIYERYNDLRRIMGENKPTSSKEVNTSVVLKDLDDTAQPIRVVKGFKSNGVMYGVGDVYPRTADNSAVILALANHGLVTSEAAWKRNAEYMRAKKLREKAQDHVRLIEAENQKRVQALGRIGAAEQELQAARGDLEAAEKNLAAKEADLEAFFEKNGVI